MLPILQANPFMHVIHTSLTRQTNPLSLSLSKMNFGVERRRLYGPRRVEKRRWTWGIKGTATDRPYLKIKSLSLSASTAQRKSTRKILPPSHPRFRDSEGFPTPASGLRSSFEDFSFLTSPFSMSSWFPFVVFPPSWLNFPRWHFHMFLSKWSDWLLRWRSLNLVRRVPLSMLSLIPFIAFPTSWLKSLVDIFTWLWVNDPIDFWVRDLSI